MKRIAISVCAALFAAAAAQAVSTSDYVQDGLVALYDGIDNAGPGLHDPNATTWKDLSTNGYDLVQWDTIPTPACAHDGFVWTNSNKQTFWCGRAAKMLGSYNATVEIASPQLVYANNAAIWALVNSTAASEIGIYSAALGLEANSQRIQITTGGGFSTTTYSTSNMYGDDMDCGTYLTVTRAGTSVKLYNRGNNVVNWTSGTGSKDIFNFFLGYAPGDGYFAPSLRGKINGFRVYNRALTADEVKWNRLVDKVRFATTPLANANVLSEVKLVDRTLQYRVHISAGTTGRMFTINGGADAYETYDAFVTNGTTFAVTNFADNVTTPVAWLGLPSAAAFDERSCSFTVKAAPVEIVLEAFEPTHVWAGGDATSPTDFATAANWRDGAGKTAVEAPGSASRVLIPAPAEGTTTVMCANPFAVAELRIGRLASANAGTAILEVGTLGTNTVSGAVRIYAGGTLRQKANPSGETVTYRCNLEAGGDVVVASGGSITAKAQGYAGGCGYGGASIGYGNGCHSSHGGVLHAMNGGGYGGTSKCYGSVRYPVTYGSASKMSGTSYGTRGGGAIYLKTAGALRVDGEMDASAGDLSADNFYSGAGGSVQIHAQSLTGSGKVWANGGKASKGICGSGGRIAVYSESDDFNGFSGTIRTWGGRYTSGADQLSYGCCGTVYLETAAQGAANGELILDNGCPVGNGEVEFNEYVTDCEVGRVRVKAGGRFKVCAGGSLTVRRGIDSTSGTSILGVAGTTVTAAGTETALFRGANEFANFSCTVPDKTILFSTMGGDAFKIADGGTCVLQGEEDHPLNLWPEADGGIWKFHLGADAVADILYASVSNSNARSGASVLAIYSDDLGGNVNWGFSDPIVPGAVITWTGAEDGQWMNSANWNPMRAPVETDHALIPAGLERYPVLAAGTVLQNKVTVEHDAALTLAGGNLTVTNGFACAGAFTFTGYETLLLTGPSNSFAGATVDAANGTVRFEGELDQIFDPDGKTFSFVTFRKTGGNVTLEKGVSARVFEVMASAASVFSFAAGETFAVSELYLNGAVAGAAGLTVKSTSDGSSWFLNAGPRQQVGGVIACDSDASGGSAILADANSSVEASCQNWTTGGKAATWTGGASGKWSDAGNWTPNGVPDAETRVTIAADQGQTVSVTLDAGEPAAISNLVVGADGRGTVTLTANAPLVIGGDFDVGTNTMVVLNAFNPGNTVGGNMTVRAGGTLTHANNGTGFATVLARIQLEVSGDFVLEKGAMVDLRDKGFMGAPWGSGNGTMSAHGGRRPMWGDYTFWSGYCVGSVTEPILPGYGSHGQTYGGGAVWIAANGTARVDGDVLADGTGSVNSGMHYTGAGGSVYLRCAELTGRGMISASARGVSHSLGGSGGRIAVHQTESDSIDGFTNVTMRAYGGWDQSKPTGAPGTIYTCTRSQAAPGGTGGDLWIRNGGGVYGAAEISQQMEDTTVGSVHIDSGCALVVHSGRTLTVNGDFLNDGSLVCSNNSTVVFATTNNALVRGENEFYNLTCTTGEKTMRFAPQTEGNSIVRVRTGGTLTLTGTDKQRPLVLTNATEDAAWKLTLAAGTEQQVMYVAAAGSDANGGTKIVAKSSRDDGNNENWSFPEDIVPGEEIVWTGAVSNDFGDPANWDRERAPEPTDFVKIAASANDPVVTHSFTGNKLEILSGATLTLNGANLALTNDLRCAGTLAITDFETVRLEGNVDFTGGTYVTRRETLTLGGDAAVTVNFAGNDIHYLKLAKTGGAISFTKGFSADTFICVPDVSQALTFGAGETFEFADLILDGSAAALTLASTAETDWKLKVTRKASVMDVAASDSDASAGFPVYAEGASTCTRCTNWFSGADATVKTWIGEKGDFTDAAKWSPEGVPGETNRVVVPSGTVTISTNVTVRGLTVGGGAAAAGIRVTQPLTVTGGAEALTNGTFTFDAPVTLAESLVVRSGGVVTHTANPATVTHPTNELYKLAVWVGADIIVDKGGRITANGCGYRAGKGPGAGNVPLHGGTAGNYNYGGGEGDTYGSIAHPVTLGSGCSNQNGGHGVGGGAVRLTAVREVRVEGGVTAVGAAAGNANYYSGAGGSVWITAGRLTGTGTVSANGGDTTQSNAGSGGRVALYLTEATDFSDWKGFATARGGQQATSLGRTGAGTVYRRAKGWTLGRVTIENGDSYIHPDVGTVIPSLIAGDTRSELKYMAFEVQKVRLTVTNDVKIADLDLSNAGALVKCYGVLTVKSNEHKDGKGWKAPYPACEMRCGGYVRWAPPGFMLIVK